jgi:hypothetical protein
MARLATCESCPSIDVRQWHREGRLEPGQRFSWSWMAGSITVQVECAAVVLGYRYCFSGSNEWKSIQQRVPISLTACHLGGQRPWFICPVYCNGRHCGRRVAVLYATGDLFACRRCYGLAYASQQESPRSRLIRRSRKIRMRLGGSPDLLQPFPKRPRGMHRRTYLHLQARDPFSRKARSARSAKTSQIARRRGMAL